MEFNGNDHLSKWQSGCHKAVSSVSILSSKRSLKNTFATVVFKVVQFSSCSPVLQFQLSSSNPLSVRQCFQDRERVGTGQFLLCFIVNKCFDDVSHMVHNHIPYMNKYALRYPNSWTG